MLPLSCSAERVCPLAHPSCSGDHQLPRGAADPRLPASSAASPGVARAQGRSRRLLQQSALVLRRAATSGELTLEWREERGLGHGPFKRCNLKDLAREPLRNGQSVRDREGDYVPRLSCLKSSSVDWTESKRGNWDGLAIERQLIHRGDFLVAPGNGCKVVVGGGCLLDEPPPRMAFPDTVIPIRPDQSRLHPRRPTRSPPRPRPQGCRSPHASVAGQGLPQRAGAPGSDRLATLLRECGALSGRARFRAQLALELARGAIREISEDGQAWLEAVG